MARVTNAELAGKIDALIEAFKDFKAETRKEYSALNGRQRSILDRVTKLESRGNPKEEGASRLEDPKVLLALVGAIVALIEIIGRLLS